MRYLPLNEADRAAMLGVIGVKSVDELFADVPAQAHMDDGIGLPDHQGEMEVARLLETMAAKNVPAAEAAFFIGAGAYRHHVPAVVDHLIQRSEFLTSYTPYQPEISQGTLHALFEFQTQVAMLTGMEIANASMYDGSTACAEAMLMAHRITRRNKAVLSGNLHPQYAAVARTAAQYAGHEVSIAEPLPGEADDIAALIDEATSCVIVQTPDVFGRVWDLGAIADAAHEKGALLIAVVGEAVSLGALVPPGDMDADIVVAEGQSIGNAMNFGGPYVGLFATRQKFVRQMPGRLCGETVDADGRRGFVLTLSTREQHIRREKATSNICTNSGLCALAFTIHLALLGDTGLKRLARLNHANAVALADALTAIPGVELMTPAFFNEFTLRLARPAAPVVDALADKGVLAGVAASRLYPGRDDMAPLLITAATECASARDMEAYAQALAEVLA